MKQQDAILEQWRQTPEIWSEHVKHWKIAASAGCFRAMHTLILFFEASLVSRQSIDLTLKTYNNSCAEMRSEARDAIFHSWRTQFL